MICIYVDKSELHGLGAFSFKRIPNRSILGEYFGEIIDGNEAEERGDPANKKYSDYVLYVSEVEYIDAKDYNYPLRYINHSLTPNCEIITRKNTAFVLAIRTIQAGEELTIDYGYEVE